MKQTSPYPAAILVAASLSLTGIAAAADTLDRSSLPIPEPQPESITTLDARDAKAPPRFEVKAPAGAPNVVIVLIDDIGFGASSAFGGPIKMPTLDKMANAGLRYNRFHTTALCSPTRTALLTGHNHHANNAGAIMELATGFPGNTGIRPREITTLAQILRSNGFSTAAFGKYHENRRGKCPSPGPMIADRPALASINSTASSTARRMFPVTIQVRNPPACQRMRI